MSLKYNNKNIPIAKILRKNATRQENRLWYDFLANHALRFQRQKAIGNYIVDFYCHKAKLVIEIDGSQHYTYTGMENDKIRESALQQFDLKILRFTNQQIDQNFNSVCEWIEHTIQLLLAEGSDTSEDL